jgi:hypothetical protein
VGGVARMVRQLTVLQPGLAAAGAAGGAFRPEAVRAFERARTYYTLLTYSADSLVKVAADRPGRFTPSEYLALLQVAAGSELKGSAVRCWSVDGVVGCLLSCMAALRGWPAACEGL